MEQNLRYKNNRSYLFGILGVLCGVCIDQLSKYMVVLKLKGQEPFIIWEHVFQLQYLENRGAAFGILQGQKMFFLIMSVLVLLVMTFFYYKMPISSRYRPLRICIVLTIAGALGNMIDRVHLNYVIDFFYFELIDFPIFNVADSFVVIATIGFFCLLLFFYKEEELDFLTFKRN
ncbi:MAG: signal peptidase II [Lachnospiraceae bacterium]